MKRGILVMGYILMILMSLWTTTPVKAVEDTLPDVSLHLDHAETEVDVNYGYTGIVNFTGTVHCDTDNIDPDGEGVVVVLFWDSKYPTAISPMGLTFEPQGEKTKRFNVSLKVPNFQSSDEQIIVTINASFRMPPDQFYFVVEPVTEIIRPKPYMSISISPEYTPSILKSPPGDVVRYTLGIENYGNCMDTFHMDISENQSMISGKYRAIDERWKVVFSHNDFTLGRAEELNVTVEVSVPDDASEGTYIIIVEVTSKGRDGYEESKVVRTWSTGVKVEDEGFLSIGDWWQYIVLVSGVLLVMVCLLMVILKKKRLV